MVIDSPYPQLSKDLYNAFRHFVQNEKVNHCDLYQTLMMFVGGIVRITYNQGVSEFSEEQKIKLCSGLKEAFNDMIDIALFDDRNVH